MAGFPRILVKLEKFLELPAVRHVLGRGRLSRDLLALPRIRRPEATSRRSFYHCFSVWQSYHCGLPENLRLDVEGFNVKMVRA